jgi:NAD(P)-dependent dehydrogenase (short-subunit alcohol dehydrogenase family)
MSPAQALNGSVEGQRVALVTGGAQGIGAAICRHLAASGLRVASADIDGAGAEKLAAELGPMHCGLRADVSDPAEVASLFATVEARLGPVGVLVCSAGVLLMPGGQRPTVAELELEVWERTFAVNVRGTFLCSREFMRRRQAQPVPHGRIVLLGSVGAQMGGPRSSAAYVASKAAVMGFAKALAREVASLGITCNTIAPGLIDTAMLRLAAGDNLAPLGADIPLGRVGEVDEIAAAVDYLVSPAAGYTTGSVVDVNGGMRMQ